MEDLKQIYSLAIKALELMKGRERASLCWAFSYALYSLEKNIALDKVIDVSCNFEYNEPDYDDLTMWSGRDFLEEHLSHFEPHYCLKDGSYWWDRNDFNIRINLLKGLIENGTI